MPPTLPSISYTSRDYESIRAALIEHVRTYFPNDSNDFTSSNLGMLFLELMAYVGDQLHFYLDRVANEMFLPTAVERKSVLNLVRLIGYVPRGTSAASVSLRALLQAVQAEPVVISANTTFLDSGGETWEVLENFEIPAGRTDTVGIPVTNEVLIVADGVRTTFSLKAQNENLTPGTVSLKVTFGAVEYTSSIRSDGTFSPPFGGSGLVGHADGSVSLVFPPGNAPDAASSIKLSYQFSQKLIAYHGRTRIESVTSDGTQNQSFTLPVSPVLVSPLVPTEPILVDPNRFEIWLGDPESPFGRGTGDLWRRVESLVGAAPEDEAYALRIDAEDRVVVEFGDNFAGAIPPQGSVLNVIYRSGGGTAGNIAVGAIDTSVTAVSGLRGITVLVSNLEKGSGGAPRESLDEIRTNAPAFLRTNNTASTEQDYDTLSLFSRAGEGAIVRAKARLVPAVEVTTKTVHTNVTLGAVPSSPPSLFYLLIPATPALIETVSVNYTVAGLVRTVTAVDLGNGLASLGGDTTIDASSRMRYDEQSVMEEAPAGINPDGGTTSFSSTLEKFPVLPSTVYFSYSVDGEGHIGYDDGAGNLIGEEIGTGTLDYEDGSLSLDFDTAPDDGSSILFSYQSALRLSLTTPPDAGTEMTISMESGPSIKEIPTNLIEVYTWARGDDSSFVPPSTSLRDGAKAFLDLRRTIGTAISVRSGYNVLVHYHLTVAYNLAVSQAETNARIEEVLSALFGVASLPGTDLPLASIYDALYPLQGINTVIIEDVGLRVPVGRGDSTRVLFKTSSDDSPGEFISPGKVPIVSGAEAIGIYREDSLIGVSDGASPEAAFTTASGSSTVIVPGSSIDITTGVYTIILGTPPLTDDVISLDYLLDVSLEKKNWNVSLEEWELPVLGNIIVNGVII